MKKIKCACLGCIVILGLFLVSSFSNVNAAVPVCEINGRAHVYSAATCTKAQKCNCGATKGIALGHDYSKYVKTREAATCTKTGRAQYKCSRCTSTTNKTISMKAHEYVYKSVSATKHVLKCKACSKTSGSEVNHTFRSSKCLICSYTCSHTSYEYKTTQSATCINEGKKTATCTVCGSTLSQTFTIPAKGHDWVSSTKNATCTVAGSIVNKCTVCRTTETKTIPATGHNYKYTTTRAATCTGTGVKTGTCTNCNSTKVESIPYTGHDWVSSTKNATCTVDGSIVNKCTVCRTTETKTIPATGHKFVGHKCTLCGAANPNSSEKEINETTCVHPSYSKGKCTKCGEACEHKKTEYKITKNATCTVNGVKSGVCTVCEETTSATITIPATGHDWVSSTQNATCTVEGSIVNKCTVCKKTETNVIPATGHKYGKDEKCTICGVTNPSLNETEIKEPKEPEVIDSDCTHTSYVKGKCIKCDLACQHESKSPATCTKAAICTTCKMSIGEPSKHSYTYKEEIVFNDRECKIKIVRTAVCSVCKDKAEEITEKEAHDYIIVEEKEATCIEKGKKVRKCKTCGIQKEDEIGKKAHEYLGVAGYSSDSKLHYKHCIYCNGVELHGQKHSWGLVNKEEQKGKCRICGYICKHNSYVNNKCIDCKVPKVEECMHNETETVSDAYGHYERCIKCSYSDKSNRKGHIYEKKDGRIEYVDLCNGKHRAVCTECKYNNDSPHVYIKGKCVSCGITDPNGLQDITKEVEQIDIKDKEEIKKLQNLLDEMGYDPKGVDGIIGQNTRKAINEMLENIGTTTRVSESSPITSEIFALLMSNKENKEEATKRVLTQRVKAGEATEEENIKYMQSYLKESGFYVGEIDGEARKYV